MKAKVQFALVLGAATAAGIYTMAKTSRAIIRKRFGHSVDIDDLDLDEFEEDEVDFEDCK